MGQTRSDAATSAANKYELDSGYLYFDDQAPIFPTAITSTPTFMYWVQNASSTAGVFYMNVKEDVLPLAATETAYQLRSGLDLTKIYYRISPGLSGLSGAEGCTGDGRDNTWGYSTGTAWNSLPSSCQTNPLAWQPVAPGPTPNNYTRGSLALCNASGLNSCITETDSTKGDLISYAGDANAPSNSPNAETIRINADFSRFSRLGAVPAGTIDATLNKMTGNSVVQFKAVDKAGNVTFSTVVKTTPWLKTEQGDVNSDNGVIMFGATNGNHNVAYVLAAGGPISNFDSNSNWVLQNMSSDLSYPNPSSLVPNPAFIAAVPWRDVDYATLIAKAQTTNLGGFLNNFETSAGSPQTFVADGVYYAPTGLTINASPSGYYTGVQNQQSATIVVDGDLNVLGNFVLQNGGYLAFLVRGNITIAGTVNKMNGTYLADYKSGYFGTSDQIQKNAAMANTGVINTGDDSGSPTQLVVLGQLIARAGFVFNRVFIYDPVSGTNGPAERIVFDPQIVLNTPPGLKDVPGLGAWTEVRPGQ